MSDSAIRRPRSYSPTLTLCYARSVLRSLCALFVGRYIMSNLFFCSAAESSRISFENLKTARNKNEGYSSEVTRTKLTDRFRELLDGTTPYDWQVDIAEALLLGMDSVLIAGTGAGKTLPFIMPLFVDDSQSKRVIIISPLNELERDQVSRCWSFLTLLFMFRMLGTTFSKTWFLRDRGERRELHATTSSRRS